MSKRDDSVYIKDILESAKLILTHIGNSTEAEYCDNILLQDAVNRRFEIIGEASAKLSSNFRQKNIDVEWSLIIAMRNKLIHEYFGLSCETVYRTAIKDIPILIEKLSAVI